MPHIDGDVEARDDHHEQQGTAVYIELRDNDCVNIDCKMYQNLIK